MAIGAAVSYRSSPVATRPVSHQFRSHESHEQFVGEDGSELLGHSFDIRCCGLFIACLYESLFHIRVANKPLDLPNDVSQRSRFNK